MKVATITRRCVHCGKSTKIGVGPVDYQQWKNNLVTTKEAFPHLNDDQRRWLDDLCCPECSDKEPADETK